MPAKQSPDATFRGFVGPIYPPDTEMLNLLYDTQKRNAVELGGLFNRDLAFFNYKCLQVSQDGYRWAIIVIFKFGLQYVWVAFPSKSEEEIDDTHMERSIALYHSQSVTEDMLGYVTRTIISLFETEKPYQSTKVQGGV